MFNDTFLKPTGLMLVLPRASLAALRHRFSLSGLTQIAHRYADDRFSVVVPRRVELLFRE